jgi:tetratricopeptide (TPR) repeat protein
MDWAQQAQQWTILVGLTEALLGPDAYYSFLAQRGYWDESLERASQALQAATKAQDMAAEARFNADLGLFYYWQGKNEEARTHYQAAITRFEASGNTQGMIQILHRLGFIEDDEDNYAQASELYQRSLKLSEKLGKPDLISVSRCLVAVVDYHQGNYIKARQRMEQSLKEELARGDKAGIARTSRRLGAVARMQGHYAASAEKRRHLDEARRLLGESLKLETNLRSRARGLRQLGMVAQEEGNLKEALKHYSDSLDLFARLGNKKGIASVKCNLGSIYRERGNYEKARQVCQESLVMARELQTHYGEALTLRELAHIAWKERDLSTARNLLQQAVDILESIHSHRTSEFKMELDKLA